MAEGNADFVISVDMQGQGPMDFNFTDLAQGAHLVTITGVEEYNEKKGSWRFHVVDEEPESVTKGLPARVTIGKDMTKKGNRGHLANLLVGIGLKPEAIRGKVEFKASQLVGKQAFITVKPAAEGELTDEGKPAYASYNFVTKEMYEITKKVGLTVRAKPTKATANTLDLNANGAGQAGVQQIQPQGTPQATPDVGNLFSMT
jgi:hypothetical protein